MGFVLNSKEDFDLAMKHVQEFLDTEIESKEDITIALKKLTAYEIELVNQIISGKK